MAKTEVTDRPHVCLTGQFVIWSKVLIPIIMFCVRFNKYYNFNIGSTVERKNISIIFALKPNL